MLNIRQASIRAQVMTLLVVALLLIATMGGVGLWSLGKITGLAEVGHALTAPRQRVTNDLIDAVNGRAVAARNLVLVRTDAQRQSTKAQVVAAHDKIQTHLAELRRLTQGNLPPEEKALIDAVYAAEAEYGPVALKITELAASGQTEQATQMIIDQCVPLLDRLVGALNQVIAFENRAAEADFTNLNQTDRQARIIMMSVGAVALLAMVLLGMLIARGLIDSTQRAVQAVQQMAAGDLTVNIAVRGDSEMDRLLKAVNQMAARLRDALAAVRSAADQIGSASSEIATGSNDLSLRTEQTASNLQETAASMEQLTATVRQSSDSARQANHLAGNAAGVAQHGGEVVGRVVDTMGEINQSSQRINDIIGVIDGIAFQTNILALNAAVEAARAGEQGRGFAVVAGEVRSLAQRSAEAAKEIKQLISDSVAKVEAGTVQVREAGSIISDVVDNARRVNDIVSEMMASSAEQADGIGQINTAVSQLDQMTQQNAALVEQSTAAAESLQEQARRLVEVVGVFNIGGHSVSVVERSAAARVAPRVASKPMAKPAPKLAPSPVAKKLDHAPKPAAPKPTGGTAVQRLAAGSAAPAPAPKASDDDGDWTSF